MNVLDNLDILIVGAGFAGIYHLHHLRGLGYSVKVFEAASDLGGVWYWNCYPGARVDSLVPVYEFSDEILWKDWSWSERYPDREELRRYFRYVDEKLDIKKDVVFNRNVVSAYWDSHQDRWAVTSEEGTVVRPRFLILCTGFASKPYVPDFKGLDSFQGICVHTTRWPQEGLDLRGKRVAVIGTGASGVQVVQEAGPEAFQLTVYQRTPNIAFPMRQVKLDEGSQKKMKDIYPDVYRRRRQTFGGHLYDRYPKSTHQATPEERVLFFENLWNGGGLEFLNANYNNVRRDQEANDEIYAFWKKKVRERVNKPEMREILAPTVPPHPVGAKRPSLELTYYETFNLPHVDLVDLYQNPIVELTPDGILTADGVERHFDVIVLASGFDAITGGITQIDIRGRDQVTIAEKWKKGVDTNLGMTSSGFPNMFFVYGPQAPSVLANGPSCIEVQGEWIINCIKHLTNNGMTRIEPTTDAEAQWRHLVFESVSKGLFSAATSVFLGKNIPGKFAQPLVYASGIPTYVRICEEIASKGYEGFVISGKQVSTD